MDKKSNPDFAPALVTPVSEDVLMAGFSDGEDQDITLADVTAVPEPGVKQSVCDVSTNEGPTGDEDDPSDWEVRMFVGGGFDNVKII